jgi:sterol 14-demethylase
MIAIVIAAVIAVALLYVILPKKRPSNSPPIASIGVPLIGNYIEFATNPIDFIGKCYKKFGSVYTVPMLHKNLTFLLGPEASTPFFKLNDDFMNQSEVYGFMTPVFGKGVVYDAEPKKRIQQMQSMAQGLKSKSLKSYVPKIEKETIDYLKRWGDKGERNLLDDLSELTILSSSRCLHGDDVREILFEDVARIYHDLDKGVSPLSFFFPYAPTAAHKARDAARTEMVNIFSKVIAARREPGIDNSHRTDILQVFCDLEYKEGGRLSDDEIVGLLIALLFAGQHTSSITSTWTAMFLLHHPKCLEKVMDEQKASLESNSTPLDADNVSKMEYLQNCVKEALRLHPPLIMLMRMAMQDIETTSNGETFVIPKGDIVVTSPAAASRLESVFPNADLFQPERFENPMQTYAYLGFGGGMHACMGQQFGLLQVKTILSVMFRNFIIEPIDKEFPEPDYTAMVVGPKNHCRVRYTKRPDAYF